jgi:two-component system aerobic respiration control sensor histidine kinase ArcB
VKHLDLQLEIAEDVPAVVIGDDFRLQRILINLLSNAIKFTDQGFVRLRVNATLQTSENIMIHFYVEDTGIGIEKSYQDMIFESFSRVTPSSTGRYVGTGLGLKAVKHFSTELGGSIQVESELNQGATFICSLPFKICPVLEEIALIQTHSPLLDLGVAKRVLVVEDSPIALYAAVEILTKQGLIVDTATTAKQAITKAYSCAYQLIILDLGLPDLPGLEVARRIRHSTEAKTPQDTPILVLTANAGESYQTECQTEGINAFITKPLTLEKLHIYLVSNPPAL